MSRRESRNSTGGRSSTGTGSLEEFENFKKKYLLVNKHIAKLNSSLNIRVEDLMSQIKLLNMEIMGLRSSEMTLRKQLKEEQTKSKDIYMQSEIAARMLITQINALKISCGYDKPSPPSPVKSFNARPKAARPRQRPQPRLSQAPDYEAIVEISEDDATPNKSSRRREVRDAPSPPPSQLPNSTNYATPVRRRRSTGSTPSTTPTPNSNPTSGPNGSSEHERRSSDPTSMDISTGAGSSPLTPCPPSFSVTSESAAPTPARATSVDNGKVNSSDASSSPAVVEKSSLSSLPHINLLGMGLKRLSRRPSGLIASQVPDDPAAKKEATESKESKDSKRTKSPKGSSQGNVVTVPVIVVPSVDATSYPTPVSAKQPSSDAPTSSTPPRAKNLSLAVPRSISPTTPTRSFPMSPVLSANPALSPPPARKPSLTRMQLDFGIKPEDDDDSDEGEADGDANGDDGEAEAEAEAEVLEEGNTVETTATVLIDFTRDRSTTTNGETVKRGAKRKAMEDDAEEVIRPPEVDVSQRPVSRGKRDKSERRDTGTVLNATEIKERPSKDSLRDVTNERHSSPKLSNGIDSAAMKDKPKPSESGDTQVDPFKAEDSHRKAALRSIAGITAKLERIASSARTRPLPPNVNIPPPSRNNSVISLQETLESLRLDRAERKEQDENGDAKGGSESDTAANDRRNSGRQRKSVNYKEPSLVTKMRKPDAIPQPPPSSTSNDIASRVEALSALAPHPTAPVSVPKPPKRKKGSISFMDDIQTPSSSSTITKHLTSASFSSLASLRGDAQGHQDENAIENDQGNQGTRAARLALRDKLKEDVNGQDDDDEDDDDEYIPNGGSYPSSGPLSSRYPFGALASRDNSKIASSLTGSSLPGDGVSSSFLSGPRLTGPLGMRPVPGAARERVRERELAGLRRDRERPKERDRDMEKERETESASIAT